MDKNYALENDLVELERRMSALIEQNWLLHNQLTAGNQVERVSKAAAEDRMDVSEEPVAMRGGGVHLCNILGTEGQDSVSSRARYDKKCQQTIAHETNLAHHAKSGFSSTMQQCTNFPLRKRELGPAGIGEELE